MNARGSQFALASDPQILHLSQILEDMDRGHILIPRFQRPLVWPKDMRLGLLDSILRRIPIGAITLWRTRFVHIAETDHLGPFTLPTAASDLHAWDYVLDGEQRLATLYFALMGAATAPRDDRRADEYRVLYDLRDLRFVTRDDVREVSPYHLPLVDVLRGANLVKFQRELAVGRPHDEADALIGRCDEVARAFREHMIVTQLVRSDDLELVTLAFARINSAHIVMSEVHMANALTWSPQFDLLGRIQQMREGALAEIGWGDINDLIILRVCKVFLGMAINELTENVGYSLRQRPDVLDDVTSALSSVARFLRRYCGIRVPSVVPFAGQIVVLASALFLVPEPNQEVAHHLRDWFWFTTYAEMFQGQISDSRFEQLLGDVLALAAGKVLSSPASKQPTRSKLTRFHFRNSRARGLALLLAKQKPRDPRTPAKEPALSHASRLLAELGPRGLAHLVTSIMTKDPAISASPGARVLIRPESIGHMRRLLQSAEPPPDEFLRSHVIRPEAWKAFHAGDYATFVKLREDDLNRMEETRFQRIVRRLYPTRDPLTPGGGSSP